MRPSLSYNLRNRTSPLLVRARNGVTKSQVLAAVFVQQGHSNHVGAQYLWMDANGETGGPISMHIPRPGRTSVGGILIALQSARPRLLRLLVSVTLPIVRQLTNRLGCFFIDAWQ